MFHRTLCHIHNLQRTLRETSHLFELVQVKRELFTYFGFDALPCSVKVKLLSALLFVILSKGYSDRLDLNLLVPAIPCDVSVARLVAFTICWFALKGITFPYIAYTAIESNALVCFVYIKAP